MRAVTIVWKGALVRSVCVSSAPTPASGSLSTPLRCSVVGNNDDTFVMQRMKSLEAYMDKVRAARATAAVMCAAAARMRVPVYQGHRPLLHCACLDKLAERG